MRFENRIAIVTGAGSGMGRAIASALAAEGANVVASDMDLAAAEETADLIAATGGEALALAADVTSSEDCTRLLAAAAGLGGGGRLDILVNNAGINVRADLRHLTDEDWLKIRATNLHSIVRLSRDAFDLLRRGTGPSILNVSSIMAERSLRQLGAYSATKAAVSALSRSLAVEYAAFGIRVNHLMPGFVETRLTERALRNPGIAKSLIDQTPMRRFGTPDDIARAALFLVSDDAAYITGAGLAVDGGMSAGL